MQRLMREGGSLAPTLERARRRLEQARGGDVEVRDEALSALFGPPKIYTQPRPAKVPLGDSATFEVAAQGRGKLSYQWYKDGRRIHKTGLESQSPKLVIRGVNLGDAGKYHCRIVNEDGQAVSEDAELTVDTAEAALRESGQAAPGSAVPAGFERAQLLLEQLSSKRRGPVGTPGGRLRPLGSSKVDGISTPVSAVTTREPSLAPEPDVAPLPATTSNTAPAEGDAGVRGSLESKFEKALLASVPSTPARPADLPAVDATSSTAAVAASQPLPAIPEAAAAFPELAAAISSQVPPPSGSSDTPQPLPPATEPAKPTADGVEEIPL